LRQPAQKQCPQPRRTRLDSPSRSSRQITHSILRRAARRLTTRQQRGRHPCGVAWGGTRLRRACTASQAAVAPPPRRGGGPVTTVCPLSTRRGTRLVRLVRGRGWGAGRARAPPSRSRPRPTLRAPPALGVPAPAAPQTPAPAPSTPEAGLLEQLFSPPGAADAGSLRPAGGGGGTRARPRTAASRRSRPRGRARRRRPAPSAAAGRTPGGWSNGGQTVVKRWSKRVFGEDGARSFLLKGDGHRTKKLKQSKRSHKTI